MAEVSEFEEGMLIMDTGRVDAGVREGVLGDGIGEMGTDSGTVYFGLGDGATDGILGEVVGDFSRSALAVVPLGTLIDGARSLFGGGGGGGALLLHLRDHHATDRRRIRHRRAGNRAEER